MEWLVFAPSPILSCTVVHKQHNSQYGRNGLILFLICCNDCFLVFYRDLTEIVFFEFQKNKKAKVVLEINPLFSLEIQIWQSVFVCLPDRAYHSKKSVLICQSRRFPQKKKGKGK